jgi:hypothetical protein
MNTVIVATTSEQCASEPLAKSRNAHAVLRHVISWICGRAKPQTAPILSECCLQTLKREGSKRLVTAIGALVVLNGCTAAAPSREPCDIRILNQAAAEGLEITSISMRRVSGGREDNHFQGCRAELKASEGRGYGALTNRSCTHVRIWQC